MIEYRGFMIEVQQRQGLGWTARWEEIAGDTVRHTYERTSQDDAVSYAKGRIDEYHTQINHTRYTPRPRDKWGRR